MSIIKLVSKCLNEYGLLFTYKHTGLHTITISDGITLRINNDGKYIAFYYYGLREEQRKNETGITKEDIQFILDDAMRVKRIYEDFVS